MRKMLIIMLTVILAANAFADRRNYVWTYQYAIAPKSATELEFYQTSYLREQDESVYEIEVEHGITDRLDFSVYEVFSQTEGEALKWEEWKLKTRFRLGEQDQYFLDPILYFEYVRPTDSKAPNEFELKLILAKQKEQFNFALNLTDELIIAPGTKQEFGLDAAASWEFSPSFIFGLESSSQFEKEESKDEIETASYVGPTVSAASGNWWYNLGVGFGITEDSDKARVRFLMGVGL